MIDLKTLRFKIDRGDYTIGPDRLNFEASVAIALLDRIDELETRRDELLATVVKVTNSTPFADEAKDALEQRGALVAEVGTLKSTVASLRRELAEQYPIATLAREVADWSDDSAKTALLELRLLIDSHAKQTEAAKLEYLPSRFRGTP
jgi:hypothetical protein